MSVEVPVGGQWEVIDHYIVDAVTNGYTRLISVDGAQYRRLRFFLGYASQSLLLMVPNGVSIAGAINRQYADGTGEYLHPNGTTNTPFDVMSRGTGYLQGYCIPRRAGTPGWLMTFRGYSADAANWNDAPSVRKTLSGRIFWYKTSGAAGWDFQFGFASYAGQAGSVQILFEGERQT